MLSQVAVEHNNRSRVRGQSASDRAAVTPDQTALSHHSAPLRFQCPACQMVLEVPAELAGVCGPCPGCRATITAPVLQRTATIEIKPRPCRPPREGRSDPVEQSVAPDLRAPIPAMGQPPTAPPPVKADPPVPRQPPIPSSVEKSAQQSRLRSGSRTRRRRTARPVKRKARSRPEHSINPLSVVSEKYREKKETVTMIKILVAILLTIVIAIVIARITKKSVAAPSYEHSQEG